MSYRGQIGIWSLLLLSSISSGCRAADSVTAQERIERVLKSTPLIDGHNDLPWALDNYYGESARNIDLTHLDGHDGHALHTDLARLRRGGVGGQFWSVFVANDLAPDAAVRKTLEQIDLVKSFTAQNPNDLEMAVTAADVRRIHAAGRIASLLGVEGGHQIGGSLSVLRQFRALGVVYMTLTHSRSTEWADSATDQARHGGMTRFGRDVVREMNQLGMLVDLSHVSPAVMKQVLDISTAPVIFSHSGARGVVDHSRNVPDEILRLLPENGGVVMVVFYPGYVSSRYNAWLADRAGAQARIASPPFSGLYIGQPERARQAMAAWEAENPAPVVTVSDVADHIDYIRNVAGVDHVGIGSDFDGVGALPQGLSGVDTYPALLTELARRGWSDADLGKLLGQNILRVMQQAEDVALEKGQ